jgi:hypothetical protein
MTHLCQRWLVPAALAAGLAVHNPVQADGIGPDPAGDFARRNQNEGRPDPGIRTHGTGLGGVEGAGLPQTLWSPSAAMRRTFGPGSSGFGSLLDPGTRANEASPSFRRAVPTPETSDRDGARITARTYRLPPELLPPLLSVGLVAVAGYTWCRLRLTED